MVYIMGLFCMEGKCQHKDVIDTATVNGNRLKFIDIKSSIDIELNIKV